MWICGYLLIYECSNKTMGKMNLNINDKVDRKFRDAVYKKKGMKKGNLTDSVEEAMLMWVASGKE